MSGYSCCFWQSLGYFVFSSKRVKYSAILVLLSRNNDNLDSRASELLFIILTFMLYLYWFHFPYIAKRLPNLVNAKWLWTISLGIWANQKPRTISWVISEIMGYQIIMIWRKFRRNSGIEWDIQKDGGCPSCQNSAS